MPKPQQEQPRGRSPRRRKPQAEVPAARNGKKPRCRRCGRAIPVPKGWTGGPAVRKHYWAKHPEVMQPRKKGGKR